MGECFNVLAAKDVNASGEAVRGLTRSRVELAASPFAKGPDIARSRIPSAKQVSEMTPCKL